MMKKMINIALMAVTVCGLALSVASCKDDDNNNGNSGEDMEKAASTGGDMTLAESQLASLISHFSDVQADEVLDQSNWKSKTYEADLGLVLEESRPTVRTIAVGTLEAANEKACNLLDALGIDYQSPNGFSFADSEVGTVSYGHGGGADANTLATININVKQLPGIKQLQLVREMPANAAGSTYYRIGDIIRKKGDNRLWICVSSAESRGDEAYFVSFDTDHPTGTCGWGSYDDIVYAAKKPMASGFALSNWMSHILLHDANYEAILRHLEEANVEDHVNDLMPATENARKELIDSLYTGAGIIVHFASVEKAADVWEISKWQSYDNGRGRLLAPRGRLLCDKFRWSTGNGRLYEYWVPCIYWFDATFFENLEDAVNDCPWQLEGSHFKWSVSERIEAKCKYITKPDWPIQDYRLAKLATYWQHKYYTLDGKQNQWAVFDFTKDWKNHDIQGAYWSVNSKSWVRRNITSSELLIKDRGKAKDDYDVMWKQDKDLEE